MEISGARVLLTGASGGLGQAIARELAMRGAKLTLTGRRVDVLEPLAIELDARTLAVDLSSREEVQRLVDETGELDVLIANAALPGSGRLDSYTVEQLDRVIEVNLRVPIVLAHAFAPPMMSARRGQLVFMGSLSGKAATPGSTLYNATKFGLRGFAHALRAELHATGVGVSLISPGFISEAGMFADSGATLPFGVGTRAPHDVAAAVVTAIEHDRAEIDVAPLTLRAGAAFASVSPAFAARAAMRFGGDQLAHRMAHGQAGKR